VNQKSKLLQEGRAALAAESAAIAALQEQLDESFVQAVDTILSCQGHVLVSGAGTSSAVARRLAHLLTCVGAPALYLDAGQSAHGSAAAVMAKDIVFAISKGGETDELNNLVRVAREKEAKVISLTESKQSSMARLSDVVLSRGWTWSDCFGQLTGIGGTWRCSLLCPAQRARLGRSRVPKGPP